MHNDITEKEHVMTMQRLKLSSLYGSPVTIFSAHTHMFMFVHKHVYRDLRKDDREKKQKTHICSEAVTKTMYSGPMVM